jgi:hypothetical protein
MFIGDNHRELVDSVCAPYQAERMKQLMYNYRILVRHRLGSWEAFQDRVYSLRHDVSPSTK